MQHNDRVGVNETNDPEQEVLVARGVVRGLLFEVQPRHLLSQGKTLSAW